MPTSVTYPGVYIQEVPSGVQTITGVATSIAAFVGWAPMGPTNEATLILSWQDFVNQFGGMNIQSYLGYAVNQFFNNGGQQAYIVRLVADGTNTTTPADWASVAVTALSFTATTTTSTVNITLATPPAIGATIVFPYTPPVNASGLTLSATNLGAWGNNYGITIQPRVDDYTRFSLSVFFVPGATAAQVQANFALTPPPITVVESFQNLSLDPNDVQSRYVVNVINSQSNFIQAAMSATAPLPVLPKPTTFPSPPPTPGSTSFLLAGATSGIAAVDGTVLKPSTSTSGTGGAFESLLNIGSAPPNNSGVHLLDNVSLFNILCVPGEITTVFIGDLQQYCFTKRAFYIVDSDPAVTALNLASATSASGIANLGISGAASINSAFYFPWVQAPDAQNQGRTRMFPPSGFVAGIYAATDASRGVWKAPAGINAVLSGSTGLVDNLTDSENGPLNQQAVNCLRTFNAFGNVVWGARTLNGNDAIGSEWKYVPVRRLALFLEQSLIQGTQFAVFEPNADPLWSELRTAIGSFMQNLFRQGAFAGQTAAEAFFVKCDSQTTTQSDINNGIVNIQVGFAPLNPAEFVVISIQQQAGQA